MNRFLSIALALALAAPEAGAAGPTLAEGGFSRGERGGPQPDGGAFALRARLAAISAGAATVSASPRALPKALGDSLVVSLDDGVAPVGGDWESRLDVSGGPAGPADAIAVRFPASALAVAPPFDVSQVIVGLDDRHGVTSWPVELWLEDSVAPLQPRQGGATVSGLLDAAASGLVPVSGGRPSDFRRVAVPLRLSVPDAWLSDGAFDDDFERTAVPLADADWVECEDATCGTRNVMLSGGRAVRETGGGALLAVRFPSAPQESMRPHRDLDVHASVRIAESAAGFRRAGLALRVIAPDAYYRIEYIQTPPQVQVTAVLPPPFGDVAIGAPLPVGTPTSGTRTLDVTVTGTTPSVRFDVSVDGVPLGTVTDATWRLAGWYAGLTASDPAGAGEAWDDFRVERRPDVFAVVAFPPGADAGLPLDVSDLSLASQSVLESADGTSFSPLGLRAGCANPGNPFVQLRVEDSVTGDRLFQREAHVVAVGLDCPTCTPGPGTCSRNLGVSEHAVPALVPGAAVTASVRWWNEHLADDTVLFRGTLWSGPCESPGAQLATATVTGVPSLGQGTATVSAADVLAFTPSDPGPHCLTIEELHDVNGDCCPDGEETTPLGGCAGACTPVAPSDSNGGTRWTLVDLLVGNPCASPKGEDVGRDGPTDTDGDGIPDEINLDGTSLRVARGAAADEIDLAWSRHDALVFPAIYHVHAASSATFARDACYLEQAPVLESVVGSTAVTLSLPTALGDAAWIAVHETDGCDGGRSVPDDSADDADLGCP